MEDDGLAPDAIPPLGMPVEFSAEHYGSIVALLKTWGFEASLGDNGLVSVIRIQLQEGTQAFWCNTERGWACTIIHPDQAMVHQSEAPIDAEIEDVARMIASVEYEVSGE